MVTLLVDAVGMRTTLVGDDGEVVGEPSPFNGKAVTHPDAIATSR
jgi:hypothetical protein